VQHHGQGDVAGESVLYGQSLKNAAVEMADAAAVGADPEIAMVAEGYRVDVVGGEPVGSREILEALAVKMADAAVSGEPEISPRIGENAVHLIMGQTFAGRKGSELATVKAADAVVAAGEPQVPVSILVDGAHAAGCETVFFGVGGEALAIVAGDGRASHLGPLLDVDQRLRRQRSDRLHRMIRATDRYARRKIVSGL